MKAVAEGLQATTIIPESPRNRLAAWHIRAGAMAVDMLPGNRHQQLCGIAVQKCSHSEHPGRHPHVTMKPKPLITARCLPYTRSAP